MDRSVIDEYVNRRVRADAAKIESFLWEVNADPAKHEIVYEQGFPMRFRGIRNRTDLPDVLHRYSPC